jgi:hypothetical protein
MDAEDPLSADRRVAQRRSFERRNEAPILGFPAVQIPDPAIYT